MENESRKWWKDRRGERWKKKESSDRDSGRHILVQSASWRCISFTDSVQRNPLLIRMILMSFWCFLFIWFAFYFFQINFCKSNMRKYCWLMSYRYEVQLARKTWGSMPPGKPLKQTRNERGAQTGSHVDIRLTLGLSRGTQPVERWPWSQHDMWLLYRHFRNPANIKSHPVSSFISNAKLSMVLVR